MGKCSTQLTENIIQINKLQGTDIKYTTESIALYKVYTITQQRAYDI